MQRTNLPDPMVSGVFPFLMKAPSLSAVALYQVWIAPLTWSSSMRFIEIAECMNKMSAARSFFAAGIIDGMYYVAGGNSSELFELDSAEDGYGHSYTPPEVRFTTQDETVGRLAMSAILREGWTGLSTLIDGHLFVVSDRERIYVVGHNLHVAIGHLSKLKLRCASGKEWNYLVE
ncbi:hypothetical protein FRX31_034278 [Thalictrum thalictroides]|uniref:Uncharacterized protein n=1 Tax=Thalictrum thalictroides TaxID=46969 RepID=A0A7J6UVA6_THATH|nr:hypothetical protein FRX31_034278 [Thalictrum thalictroides]